jgi:hypothetical protein
MEGAGFRRAARSFRRPALAGLLFFLLATTARPGAAEPLWILFIGNSLTSSNDLPTIFASLVEAAGKPRPITGASTVGGFSLEDHWNRGEAQKTIATRQWDIVVLQQGPSALSESRRLLVSYAQRFDKAIRAAGAKPALYMVWPSTERQFDFEGVSASYTAAARAVDGTLLPAGDAWRKVLHAHREITLYSEDGLHPTFAGSYLAALVIYERLFQQSCIGLPVMGLPIDTARTLQQAAHDVAGRR